MTQSLEVIKAGNRESCDHIQESLDTFIDWAKDWQMQFHMKKFKVLGMGKNNENRNYMMQGPVLERISRSWRRISGR